MSVIDASVAVKWFVAEPGHEKAMEVLRSGTELVSPDLVLLETANVLRRKCKRGELSQEQWQRVIEALPSYFDWLLPSSGLIKAAVQLAIELDHPVYDCVYLACAASLGTTVITADTHFAGKIERAGCGGQI